MSGRLDHAVRGDPTQRRRAVRRAGACARGGVGRRRRGTGDRGSASVEFVLFGIGLLVPLAYVLVTIFAVQSAAYGVSSASREAGRAFVQSPVGADPYQRAYTAAWVALQDHDIELAPSQLAISCSATPCLTPGATVEVSIGLEVALPLVPRIFDEVPASVGVNGRHTAVVDRFRPGG